MPIQVSNLLKANKTLPQEMIKSQFGQKIGISQRGQ